MARKLTTAAAFMAGAVACAAVMYQPTVAAAARPAAADAARCAETARNRAVMLAFSDIFYRQGNIERAMMAYVVPDYIQHSPRIPTGRAAMLEMAKKFANSPAKLEVKRLVVDGDIAVVQIRGQLRPDMPAEAVFDMYRLKDGKIVEHWDVAQPVPATSANANTMF